MAFDPLRARAYVESGLWRDDTLRGWLERNALREPDAAAVIHPGGTVTWRELEQRVTKIASGLHRIGVRPGDVVAVQLPNAIEYIESFLAIGFLGAVMTTLYLSFRDAELTAQLVHSRAKAMIAPHALGDFSPPRWALQNKSRLPNLANIIVVGEPIDGTIGLGELGRSAAASPADLPAPNAADPFLLLYTSGTTSNPKGVPLNYQQMLTNARLGVAEHDIRAGDIVLSAAPFGHLYALYSVQMALCAGAVTLLLPVFTPPELIKTIAANKPTHLFAGAAHIAACQGARLLDAQKLSSLRVAVLSGAAVPPDLVRHFAPLLTNGHVGQLWGMTELQAGLYTRPADAIEIAANSAGRASPATEIRIADEHGAPMPAGAEGEIQVRGPSVFAGYYNNPDATALAFTPDGWFRSGDLATMDVSGNVSLSGRLKDVINRGGVKYNPQEIELLVERHPSVAQCAIAPIPNSILGEQACCYVVLKPGAALTFDELSAFLLGFGIAKYKLPEKLEIMTEFPLTATRKIIKSRLQPKASDKPQ
jgi:non-ribosomal peptide synthetase component E (peptide arylation enzyme)